MDTAATTLVVSISALQRSKVVTSVNVPVMSGYFTLGSSVAVEISEESERYLLASLLIMLSAVNDTSTAKAEKDQLAIAVLAKDATFHQKP